MIGSFQDEVAAVGNNNPFVGVGADDSDKNLRDEAFRPGVEKAITEANDTRAEWISSQTVENLRDAQRTVWRERDQKQ
jgi:hypothetical protein